MSPLEIWKFFNLKNRDTLSFVGGGGKTTTIFKLAGELKNLNRKVLITTTTAMYNPKEEQYDYYFLRDIEGFSPKAGTITVLGDRIENGKLLGSSVSTIERIANRQLFDFILIEADGSKGKPIKAYAHYEPVIPSCTTMTVGIIGLDCLGKKIEAIAHRPEKLIRVVDAGLNDIIDEDMIVRLILDEKGLFKDSTGKKVLLLNKAIDKDLIARGITIRNILLKENFQGIVLVGDVIEGKFY